MSKSKREKHIHEIALRLSGSLVSFKEIEPGPNALHVAEAIVEAIEDIAGRKSRDSVVDLMSSDAWAAYREAFYERFNCEPPRNAKVNSQLKQLVKRIGVDAPLVIDFYFDHPNNFYRQRNYSLDLLLRDAEVLYGQWKSGQPVLTTKTEGEANLQQLWKETQK